MARKKILVINPNSTDAVTGAIDDAMAPLRITGGSEIACMTLREGPPGVESQEGCGRRHRAALRLAFDVGKRRLRHRQTDGHRSNHDTDCCHRPNRFESA